MSVNKPDILRTLGANKQSNRNLRLKIPPVGSGGSPPDPVETRYYAYRFRMVAYTPYPMGYPDAWDLPETQVWGDIDLIRVGDETGGSESYFPYNFPIGFVVNDADPTATVLTIAGGGGSPDFTSFTGEVFFDPSDHNIRFPALLYYGIDPAFPWSIPKITLNATDYVFDAESHDEVIKGGPGGSGAPEPTNAFVFTDENGWEINPDFVSSAGSTTAYFIRVIDPPENLSYNEDIIGDDSRLPVSTANGSEIINFRIQEPERSPDDAEETTIYYGVHELALGLGLGGYSMRFRLELERTVTIVIT